MIVNILQLVMEVANVPTPILTSVLTCIGCGIPDVHSQCSRCNAPYCSRECQVKGWSEHKKICTQVTSTRESTQVTSTQVVNPQIARQRLIDQLFDRVCKIIAGNVIILSAWYRNTGGRVEIEITEKLGDFSQSGTHFLHMNYVDMQESDSDCKYSDPSKCFIKFVLADDFSHERYIIIKLPASMVKSKHKQPSRDWTLMYEV